MTQKELLRSLSLIVNSIVPHEDRLRKLELKHQVAYRPRECYGMCLELTVCNEQVDCLVHGIAMGTDGEIKNKRFGHAWLEIEAPAGLWWVIDAKQQDGPVMRQVYYEAGRINPSECVRYTRREAMRAALKHEHSGPWHAMPKDVL